MKDRFKQEKEQSNYCYWKKRIFRFLSCRSLKLVDQFKNLGTKHAIDGTGNRSLDCGRQQTLTQV